jgi:hypothetical protein
MGRFFTLERCTHSNLLTGLKNRIKAQLFVEAYKHAWPRAALLFAGDLLSDNVRRITNLLID